MEELDRLAADFAARGYEPDGAALDGDRRGDPDSTATAMACAGSPTAATRSRSPPTTRSRSMASCGTSTCGVHDGSVVYHGLPQYAVPSAVDLLRAVIDYEEDAPADLRDAFRAARRKSDGGRPRQRRDVAARVDLRCRRAGPEPAADAVYPDAAQHEPRSSAAPGARIFGTAAELNRPLSWWDLFTWWHLAAMSWPTPGGGNRAHGGPIFAPWHRSYLRRLEEAIQAVTGDRNFGLPYWDWAADGELSPAAQLAAPIWATSGPPRGEVTSGPFGALRVRFVPTRRQPRVRRARPADLRAAGRTEPAPTLPNRADQTRTLADATYDRPEWDLAADSFRNKLEGWRDAQTPPRQPPRMHNRVHVFVGGSMGPASSPNDPIFFLNHCNVDRSGRRGWGATGGRTRRPQAKVRPATGPTIQCCRSCGRRCDRARCWTRRPQRSTGTATTRCRSQDNPVSGSPFARGEVNAPGWRCVSVPAGSLRRAVIDRRGCPGRSCRSRRALCSPIGGPHARRRSGTPGACNGPAADRRRDRADRRRAGAGGERHDDGRVIGFITFHPFTIPADTGCVFLAADSSYNCDPVNVVFPAARPHRSATCFEAAGRRPSTSAAPSGCTSRRRRCTARTFRYSEPTDATPPGKPCAITCACGASLERPPR